jgi:hypothetical protein
VVCPARKKDADGSKTEESALKMVPNTEEVPEAAAKNWKIFMALPEVETALADPATVKGSLKGSSKNWCFWQLLLRNRLIIR